MLALLNIDFGAAFLDVPIEAPSFFVDFFTILVFDFFLAIVILNPHIRLIITKLQIDCSKYPKSTLTFLVAPSPALYFQSSRSSLHNTTYDPSYIHR